MSGDEGKNNGRFGLGNKASKGIGRKGKRRMSKLERLAWKEVERVLADPKAADYVKRQMAELAIKYERGAAVSMTEMGTLEPVDPTTTRAYGHRNGVVILPAEDGAPGGVGQRSTGVGLAATLQRMADQGLAKLTVEEREQLERLQQKMHGGHTPLIRRAVTQGLIISDAPPAEMNGAITPPTAPPSSPADAPHAAPVAEPEAPATTQPASPEEPTARVLMLVVPERPRDTADGSDMSDFERDKEFGSYPPPPPGGRGW